MGHIFGLSALLILPIAIFVPKGIAVLFGLTALSLLIVDLAGGRKDPFRNERGMRLAAAFAILAVTSAMWSMTPGATLQKAFIFSLVLFAGLILVSTARQLGELEKRTFDIGLIAGGIIGSTVIGVEITFESPIYTFLLQSRGRSPETPIVMLRTINQGAAVAAIFLLPWTMVLKRHLGPVWASIGFLFCIIVLAFCQADTQKAALVIGVAAACIAFIGGRFFLKISSLLLVVGVLAAPWVVSALPDPLQPNSPAAELPNSSQHRLVIWQTTADHIFERPFAGSGFDTARAFYGRDQRVLNFFGGKGPNNKWVNLFEPIPLHPHNGVLQVWLELGALGAILLAVGLFFIVHRLATVENNFERSMVFGSFVTGLAIFSVSYGAWQGWWMGAIWLMMAFAAAALEGKSK